MSLFTLPKQVPVDSSGQPYPGALLYFYAAGTTTAQTVYQDVDLSVAHSQPVVADANGVFAAVYLNPDAAADYRVQVKTSEGVLLYDQDDVPKSAMTQAQIGQTLWPQTAAELAAAVTPTNYYREPGDIRRYGAVGDGTTDDSAALQAALDVSQTHPMFLPPAGSFYKITTELTIPGSSSIVIGSGYASLIRQATASTAGFVYSGATIYNLTFRDVYIGVSGSISGDIAFDLSSVSQSKFFNCGIVADDVNQGFLNGFRCYTAVDTTQASYINEFYGCNVRTAVSANARGYLFDAASGCSSNSHKIFGGNCRADSGFGVYVQQNGGGAGGTSNNILITGVTFESNADSDVRIDGGSGVDQCVIVQGCRFEPIDAGTHTAVLFNTDSQACAAISNFYTTGLTYKVRDLGDFNLILEPSPTADAIVQLGRGAFRGKVAYTGALGIFEGVVASDGVVLLSGYQSGDTVSRIAVKGGGRIEWGSGSGTADAAIERVATGTIAPSTGHFALKDGVTAPGASVGYAKLFVDTSDGDLKIIFGDGTTKTIVTDT